MDPWDAPEPKKLNSLPQAPARRRGPPDALSSIPGLPGAEPSAQNLQTTEEENPAFDSLDAPGSSIESGESGEFQVIMTPPPAKNRATPKSGGLRQVTPPPEEKPLSEPESAPPTEETEMVPIAAAEVDSIQGEESAVGVGEVSGLHFAENFSGSSFADAPVRSRSKVPIVVGAGVLFGVFAGAAAYMLVFGVGGDGPAPVRDRVVEEQPAAVAPVPASIPDQAADTDPVPLEEETDAVGADAPEEPGVVTESGNEGEDALSQGQPKGSALANNNGGAKKPVKRRVTGKSAPAAKANDEQSGAEQSSTDVPVTPAPTQNDVGLSASSSGIRLPKVGKRNRPAKKRIKKEKATEAAAEEPAPVEPAKTEEAPEEENPWGNLED